MSYVEHLFPYRGQTWEVLRPSMAKLNRDQLLWQPSAGMGIGETVWHMADTEQRWLQVVCRKRPELKTTKPDVGDANALISMYEGVRMLSEDYLIRVQEEDMMNPISERMFSGVEGLDEPGTIRWAIHHVFEHESYHAGQISLLMQMQGLKPPKF